MREIKFRAWDGSKYDIGDDGSVWSNDFNNSGKRKQLKLYKDRDGYNVVWLTIDNVRRIHAVRRLVARTFLGERLEGRWINHRNGKRDDDRAENLEYVTPRENALHGYRSNGRKHSEKQRALAAIRFKGINNPKAKLSPVFVENIRELRANGHLLREIAAMYSISVAQVGAICTNRFWV